MGVKIGLALFGFYIISCIFSYWLGGTNKQNKIENDYNQGIITETISTDAKEKSLNEFIKKQKELMEELKTREDCDYILNIDVSKCLPN